ncbi:MAG: hypothetical protein AB1782_05090 [Cyanobacteriota bacterium]
MKLLSVIGNSLLNSTLILFLIYLLLFYQMPDINYILGGLSSCFILAMVLLPINLTGYFSSIVANSCKYNSELEIDKPFDTCFKSARMALKTMIEIKLIDSNSETGEFILESSFSKINIKLEKLDEKKSKFSFNSTPIYYKNVLDFEKYVKDIKNIIISLKLNIYPEKYEKEEINIIPLNELEQKEEFKPYLLLYYRLIKLWSITFLTTIATLALYYISISTITKTATVFLFLIIFLYILYKFTTEIETTTKLMRCPICKKKLIQNNYNLMEYKAISTCKDCNKAISIINEC